MAESEGFAAKGFDTSKATVNGYNDIAPAFMAFLYEHPGRKLGLFFKEFERITSLKREHFAYAVLGTLVFLVLFAHEAGLVCNSIGLFYPAYLSLQVVTNGQTEEALPWIVYWVVFASFSLFDIYAEFIVEAFPFYWFLKAVFLFYLWLPQTCGTQKLYVNFVGPWIMKLSLWMDNYEKTRAQESMERDQPQQPIQQQQ